MKYSESKKYSVLIRIFSIYSLIDENIVNIESKLAKTPLFVCLFIRKQVICYDK